MTADFSKWDVAKVLNTAIAVGMAAIFVAIAVPLIHGALIRQRAAECANKIIQAAEAFDTYAASFGTYPQSQESPQATERVMKGVFEAYGIDWWESATELGGQWDWSTNGQVSAVVISGTRISDRQMGLLDQLLDDGDLKTGSFQRRGTQYHYIIRDHVL